MVHADVFEESCSMNEIQFWKNFKLGTELDISGRFIYNGLRCFHEMKTLHYEEEVFEVLYNLSVGLERLLKIAVILTEHDKCKDQDQFEKSLITHNHLELLKRVRDKHKLKIAAPHNEFLQILNMFYQSQRYGRFSIASIGTASQEKLVFHAYLMKHLKTEINDEFSITPNESRFKKFIGHIVGKISTQLYEIVYQEASRLNIYTYEIRYNSKAAKIFIFKEYEFNTEDVLWKELLVYFLNNHEPSSTATYKFIAPYRWILDTAIAAPGGCIFTSCCTSYIEFIKSIEPLKFDLGSIGAYLQCFGSDEKKLDVIGELETLYEDLEKPGDRLQMLDVIGNPDVHFDTDDNEEEDDE